jgi:hypothetical protein
VATNCADGRFPWSPDTPVASRVPIWEAAVANQPPGAFGPFGNWAARMGTASLCLEWPSPAGNTPLGPGPFPDVPVLAINGGYDLRTPVANAAAVVNQFPQGHLVVVPGVGHSVVSPLAPCAANTVRAWIRGAVLPRSAACPREPPFVKTLAAFPRAAAKTPASTAVIAAKTVGEAEAAWLQVVLSGVSFAPPGLYGGKVSVISSGFRMTRYSLAPGVVVSGTIRFQSGRPLRFTGRIRVSGSKATAGTLRVTPSKVSGTLGGRRVSAGV